MVNEEEMMSYNVGVPQGLGLGSVCWSLVINELLNTTCKYSDFKLYAFADDTLYYIVQLHFIFVELQKCPSVFIAKDWAEKHNLSFRLQKCNFTMIKKVKNISHFPKIEFGNKSIKYKNEIKYLELIIDCNFTWNPHINYFKEKNI